MARTRKSFQEAFQARQQAEQEKQQQKSGYFTPKAVALDNLGKRDKFIIVRLLGNTLSQHQEGTDATLISRSMVRTDDGGWLPITWSPDKNHPMWQLMFFLAKNTKETYVDEQGEQKIRKIYEHQGCELLREVLTNNIKSQYPNTWFPQDWVAVNVIDRADMDWHRKNKHTKYVTHAISSKQKSGELRTYQDIGIGTGIYNKVWDKCVEYAEHYENFDVAMIRFSRQQGNAWNRVYHAVKEAEKIQNVASIFNDTTDYASLATTAPLTDEELSWERYNFEELSFFKPTLAKTIFNAKKDFIKKVDAKYGTDFYEQFQEKIQEELEEYKATHGNSTESTSTEITPKEVVHETVQNKETVEAPVSQPTRTRTRKPQGFDISSIDRELYTAIDKLTAEEKALITGIDENEELVYNVPDDNLIPCDSCQVVSPDTFHICPSCGQEFEIEDDNIPV